MAEQDKPKKAKKSELDIKVGLYAPLRKGMDMKRSFSLALAFLGLAFAGPIYADDQSAPHLETVATIPSDGFNENIFEDSDGNFYVTEAFNSTLWRIFPNGEAKVFAKFPDHAIILGVVRVGDGFVLGVTKRTFFTPSGSDFTDLGAEVLMLDKNGQITDTISGQGGQLFNGMALDGYGNVLISDSRTASIWRFKPAEKALTLWAEDDALAAEGKGALGANGVKVLNGWVYVANKTDLAIYKVRMDAEGRSQGPFVLVADGLPAADDFAIGPDGTIYVPPAEQNAPVTTISPEGTKGILIESAPYGASAMVSADGQWLYWATGRETEHQRLVRVALP